MVILLNQLMVNEDKEVVLITSMSKKIQNNILFVGTIENNIGLLFVGDYLKIIFKWDIETEAILEKMKSTNVRDTLDLIEMIRLRSIY